jgi:hypothetical protein
LNAPFSSAQTHHHSSGIEGIAFHMSRNCAKSVSHPAPFQG